MNIKTRATKYVNIFKDIPFKILFYFDKRKNDIKKRFVFYCFIFNISKKPIKIIALWLKSYKF